jgi:signal transduction histidine kinase
LAAGAGVVLVGESQRERELERRLLATPGLAEESAPLLAEMRARHAATQRNLLLFGGLALVCVVALAVVPGRPGRGGSPEAAYAVRSEMRGMESLAKATVAQRVELDHEREARHRSEQDLHLQQMLVNRALQDKVRLGRDLHDGLVQILYATGLVLETAASRLAANPPDKDEAQRLIERAMGTLNAAIREARGTIGGLTPDALEGQSFADALAALLDHLDAARRCQPRVELDPALPAIADPLRTELLQIIREAVSNALRHGDARHLELRLEPQGEAAVRLVLRDDGVGFDPQAVTRGHGLDNLAARARSLGATLTIDSAPGHGTTITLVAPLNGAPTGERREV